MNIKTVLKEIKKSNYKRIYPSHLINFTKELSPIDDKSIIKFQGIDGITRALPFDSTISVLQELKNSFYSDNKFFSIVDCYKNDFEKGTIVSSKHLTVENLGGSEPDSEISLILLISKIMKIFEIDDYVLEISTSEIIDLVISQLDIEEYNKAVLYTALIERNKPKLTKLLDGHDENNTTLLLELFNLHGDLSYIQNKMKSLQFDESIKKSIKKYLKLAEAVPNDIRSKIQYDFCYEQNKRYYNSIHYKVLSTSLNSVLLKGGRYDEFIKSWNYKSGSGFTFYLDKIEEVINENIEFNDN